MNALNHLFYISLSHRQGGKTALNISNPRYLGPALSDGAVYVGSTSDTTAEILCFRGNMASAIPEEKENVKMYTTPSTFKKKKKSEVKLKL